MHAMGLDFSNYGNETFFILLLSMIVQRKNTKIETYLSQRIDSVGLTLF